MWLDVLLTGAEINFAKYSQFNLKVQLFFGKMQVLVCIVSDLGNLTPGLSSVSLFKFAKK